MLRHEGFSQENSILATLSLTAYEGKTVHTHVSLRREEYGGIYHFSPSV